MPCWMLNVITVTVLASSARAPACAASIAAHATRTSERCARMSVAVPFLPQSPVPNPQSPISNSQSLARRLHLVARAERLDVRDQLPDVVVVHLRAPGGHAAAASFGDAA